MLGQVGGSPLQGDQVVFFSLKKAQNSTMSFRLCDFSRSQAWKIFQWRKPPWESPGGPFSEWLLWRDRSEIHVECWFRKAFPVKCFQQHTRLNSSGQLPIMLLQPFQGIHSGSSFSFLIEVRLVEAQMICVHLFASKGDFFLRGICKAVALQVDIHSGL